MNTLIKDHELQSKLCKEIRNFSVGAGLISLML